MTESTTLPFRIDYHRYVEDVVGILETELWNRGEIDWEELRVTVLVGLSDDPTAGEAYLTAERAVSLVGDPHTWFSRPSDASTSSDAPDDLPYGAQLDGSIGYLFLPGTSGLSDQGFTRYATQVNDAMRTVDEDAPVCGWVIDLRENQGGNVFVMLLGLGPLLGDGVFLSYPGVSAAFTYDGDLLLNGVPVDELEYSGVPTSYQSPYIVEPADDTGLAGAMRLHSDRYTPHDPDAPVAVLTSPLTVSAGEGVVVAFLGRQNTRTFGMPTAGVPTGAATVQFVDGASLTYAASQARDRTGTLHHDAIRPDERVVDLFPDDDKDETLNAAVQWLETACE